MNGLFRNNNSMIWIILLLCMCGGFGGSGCDNGCGNDMGGILPILLLCMCGGFGGCDQKCC